MLSFPSDRSAFREAIGKYTNDALDGSAARLGEDKVAYHRAQDDYRSDIDFSGVSS